MRPPLSLVLALSCVLSHSVVAQEATTVPVGAVMHSFPKSTSKTIALPLIAQPVFSGLVSSVGTNTVSFAGTPFTAGELSQVEAPYFLRLQSGQQKGRMVRIISNTANVVTVDTTDNSSQTTNLNTSGFSIAAGDLVHIVPGDTLASFFGDNTPGNPLVFTAGTSVFAADTIGIYNPLLFKNDVYFFSSALGYWKNADSNATANMNNLVLHPGVSIVVSRRNNGTEVSLAVVGDVPTVEPLTKTTGGNRAVNSSTRVPVDVRLSQLNLSNWASTNSVFTADTIGVYNPLTLVYDFYFRRPDNSWRKTNDLVTEQSHLIIPAGSAIVFVKRGTVEGANSFLSVQLPYAL